MNNPNCCAYASLLIVLRFETYYVHDKDYFKKNKPFWVVSGSSSLTVTDIRQLEITHCPGCGAKLPGIQLRDPEPSPVITIVDGGNYCDTCNERLTSCECLKPEELWEIKPPEPTPMDCHNCKNLSYQNTISGDTPVCGAGMDCNFIFDVLDDGKPCPKFEEGF